MPQPPDRAQILAMNPAIDLALLEEYEAIQAQLAEITRLTAMSASPVPISVPGQHVPYAPRTR